MVKRISTQLIVGALVVSLGRPSIAAEPAEPATVPPDASAAPADALAALEEATEALTRWREAVDAGAEVKEADLAAIQDRLRGVWGNAEAIVDHARKARRAEQAAEITAAAEPADQVKAWVEQMRALGAGAAEKRTAAVAELRAALAGDDPRKQLAALQTLQQIGDVNYDKASFRALVFPLVRESTGPTLVAACYALFNTERRLNDLLLIQEAWTRRSAALDNSMSHLLMMFADGKIEGRSEEILLELLASPHSDVRREALRGLWGASVSDRLAARLVELADDPDSRHDAIYFGLSTLKPKNPAAVDKLIETLADQDWNDWDRALWGLGYGVPSDLQPRVAKALADMYVARSDPRTREKCVALIRKYAGDAAVEALPK